MANVQRVIKLISAEDINVKLSCFNDSIAYKSSEELYSCWLSFIKNCLGNCCFTSDTCALIMYCEEATTFPHPVCSSEEVISLVTACFHTPETFRLEIVTQHNPTLTWLFVLASDLA